MKSVLLIAPRFYGYWSLMKQGIERESFTVDVMLYPSSWFFKLLTQFCLLKILQSLYEYIYYRYHFKLLSVKYDFVVMVKPSIIPVNNLTVLRERYKSAKFVSYIWDDIKNDPKELDILKFFDKTFSYSKGDCHHYGFDFRPMFYNDLCDYKFDKKTIDLFYIGSYHESRFNFLVKLFKEAGEKKLECKFILRCSRFLQLSNKRHLRYKSFFRSNNLSYSEMINLLEESRCSIEIPFPGQCGTTTRPIESLATRTKIITTNRDIINNPLYHPSNCYIIDPDNPSLDIEWLFAPYHELDDTIMRFYSLSQFTKDILCFR